MQTKKKEEMKDSEIKDKDQYTLNKKWKEINTRRRRRSRRRRILQFIQCRHFLLCVT